jgi:hypothetical protein
VYVACNREIPGTPNAGFAASKGWDAATGLGSPKANSLIAALAGKESRSRFTRMGGCRGVRAPDQ